jgi:hypothetical protein
MPYGFSHEIWNRAKEEIKELLIDRARMPNMIPIPYSELVNQIQTIQFEAHDVRLFVMLGEISSEEAAAGRGMLSALVVHKTGDMQPGPGFFELAQRLGLDTSDILRCWVEEFNKVHAYWENS